MPHKDFLKPAALGFLPNWMFAYHYPRNVNKMGIPIAGATTCIATAWLCLFSNTALRGAFCSLFFGYFGPCVKA
jgi:hypothetical protein